jgi:hypothetical protein
VTWTPHLAKNWTVLSNWNGNSGKRMEGKNSASDLLWTKDLPTEAAERKLK